MLRDVQSAQSKGWGVKVSQAFSVLGGGEMTLGWVNGGRAWEGIVGHAGRSI